MRPTLVLLCLFLLQGQIDKEKVLTEAGFELSIFLPQPPECWTGSFCYSFELKHRNCKKKNSLFLLCHRFLVYTLERKIMYHGTCRSILRVFMLFIQQPLGGGLRQHKRLPGLRHLDFKEKVEV